MLGPLGLDDFDERVYRVLLVEHEGTAPAIATALGASAARVQLVIARLASLGLLRQVGPEAYQPLSPQTALMALLNQRRTEIEVSFVTVQDAIDDLGDEYRAGRLRTDPSGLVEVLTGTEPMVRRIMDLVWSITTSLWVLDRPPYLELGPGQPETNEREVAVTTDMLDRGIEIRSVYCPEAMERPGRFETVLRLAERGEQARMLPSLPFKLQIMDRRVATVPLVGGSYESIAVVHSSPLLDALIELFETYYERAEPLVPVATPVVDRPDEEDRLLLRMLHAGVKDTSIARQLGVSPRTATRRISTLIEKLGVTTRFQAGVEASRRGWL